jgi:hypothetical protein
MAFDSDHLCLADDLHVRDALAIGTIIIKPPRADAIGRGDDADKALAHRIAPGAHGTYIPLARMQPAHGVGVHEADDITARLFSPQSPPPIRRHACCFTTAIAQSLSAPHTEGEGADQRPGFFDNHFLDRG